MVCRQISYEGVEVSSEFVPSTKEPELYQETYNEFADMVKTVIFEIVFGTFKCEVSEF